MASNLQNENESSWITPGRFAVLLAILTFMSWPGIFLGLQTFIYRDFGYFSAPLAYHFRESFWRMELPLWNPLSNCGEPFLAQWNTEVLYPPAIFYVLLPFPWSLNVFSLLHVILGGLGMFFLARYWTRNNFSAAVAGTIFAFNGVMLSAVLWPSIVAGLGWMPWVVWLSMRACREGGRMLIAAAFTGALQMLSGGAEVVLLTWLLLGAICLAEYFSADLSKIKILTRFAIVALLVSALCAAQLFPFFDLLKHSERQGNYFAADSPMPPTGWVNFFVPLFNCERSQGIFYQNGQYWMLSYYTGIVTVALAALAIWRRRSVQVWLLGALTLFCLILAMGNSTPVYSWLSAHIHILGLIRFPVKFLMLPVFALPLMAACALVDKQPEIVNHKGIRLFSAWFFIWIMPLLLVEICFVWEFHLQPLQYAPVLDNGRERVILFTIILFCLCILDSVSQSRIRRWLQVSVLFFIWLDLDRQVPQPASVDPAILRPGMSRPFPAPQFGLSRAIIPPDVLSTLTFAVQPDLARNFLSHRFALFSDCNLLDDIPKCDGFFPLDLGEHALLSGNLNGAMLDFLGVSEVLTIRSNALDWTTRSTFMPLLTGGQKPVFADDTATLLALAGTNFNPRVEVYLPSDARNIVTATNAAIVQISAEKFSSSEIDAVVDASAPTVLVAAQSYYHPWHAYVDGTSVSLFRANSAFQAIAIPQGKHRVRLIYQDRAFEIGATISMVAWLGCFACCFHFRRNVHGDGLVV
jgi:hypothetical protein